VFEQGLLRWEPAVSSPALTFTGGKRKIWTSQAHIQFDAMISSYNLDAMISAFHTESAEILLPYLSKYDQESWWYAQLLMLQHAHVLYRDHVMFYNR